MRSLIIAAALATASGKILKSPNAELIENEFVVVLKANTTKAARDNHIAMLGNAKVLYTYDNVFPGYAVSCSEHDMLRISEHPDVEYVEQNAVVRALQDCAVGRPNPVEGLWGLSRVSYRTIQVPRRPVRWSGVKGADVYILDTGINYNHNDFGGRASFAFDATGEGPNDGNGHGTHCAGTAAGTEYGIAKTASLFDVKVLGRTGGGSFAGVISGIDFVTGRSGPRVASLSLGGGLHGPTNDAINRLAREAQALVSVASGNGNTNACNTSPAAATGAITVNAITNNDARAGFSNFGPCTNIFAPGQNVLSAWIGSNTATNTISGTSMACPHVTGLIADLWSRNLGASASEVNATLFSHALGSNPSDPPPVTNPGAGSPNLLAQSDCARQP